MFKNKIGYYLELLTPETMKLLEITKSKITKNEKSVLDHDIKQIWFSTRLKK